MRCFEGEIMAGWSEVGAGWHGSWDGGLILRWLVVDC